MLRIQSFLPLLSVAFASGCFVTQDEFDALRDQVGALQAQARDVSDVEARLARLEEEVPASVEKASNYARGLSEEVRGEVDTLGSQLSAVAKDARDGREDAMVAVGLSQKANEELAAYQAEVENLHAGYGQTVQDLKASFETRLAGERKELEAKVARLETLLEGAEAQMLAQAKLEVSEALAEVDRFRTEMLGELQKKQDEIDKARLENKGFEASLADALSKMDTMLQGIEAKMRMETDKMALAYRGLHEKYEEVAERVDGYKEQLRKVRTGLTGLLAELGGSAK